MYWNYRFSNCVDSALVNLVGMKSARRNVQDDRDLESSSIIWQDVEGHQPMVRPLSDFLAGIDLLTSCNPAFFPEHQELLVSVDRNCVDTIQTHVRQEVSREQAGILCGRAYVNEHEQYYLTVDAALPASTHGDSTHFKFRQESWEEIWGALGAGTEVVGWYHTHPGLGVFLSQIDMRTQQLYFRAPWQIAMVLDPVHDQIGFFYGLQGLPLPEHQYFVYSPKSSGTP